MESIQPASATTLDHSVGQGAHSQSSSFLQAVTFPWFVLAMAVGATSIVVGVIWDISWHRTIGRDTFWTPAHMAIYLGGVLGGLGGGWLALQTTFGKNTAARDSSVQFWGFRAPLGAWVAIWGAIAMLTSAPFDDWWHNAYGLDVKIISPPHMVLASGIAGIVLGAMILALSEQNRGVSSPARTGAYLYVAGLLVAVMATLTMEYTSNNEQHGAAFYFVACLVYPPVLTATAWAGKSRFSATAAAAVYMLLYMAMIWILPLFDAQPMLGPILNPVDYMVVPHFPIFLVLPALALDLLVWRFGTGRGKTTEKKTFRQDALLALALGGSFFTLLLLVQWNLSQFLVSPASESWFFGTGSSWSYNARPGSWRYRFWGEQMTFQSALPALAISIFTCRVGLAWGRWMARVKR